MATETFMMPRNLIYSMDCWGKLMWEDVYAEQKMIVQAALRKDKRTKHVYEYPSEAAKRVEAYCTEGLKKLADDYRSGQKPDAKPGDVDWASFAFYHNDSSEIEKILREDSLLQEIMRDDHEMTAVNCALVVSEKYAHFLNERTKVTWAGEYQSGQ